MQAGHFSGVYVATSGGMAAATEKQEEAVSPVPGSGALHVYLVHSGGNAFRSLPP